MKDSYPAAFEIEIDREQLSRYLRTRHRQIWFGLMGVVITFAGIVATSDCFEMHAALPWTANLWTAGWRFLWIVLGSLLVGVIGYGLSVRLVRPYVEGLLLAVDGPFLRLRKIVGGIERDHKYHFRLLQVYATKQDALMKKLGIVTLVITTSVGLQATRTIEVLAVKDCLKVRDMLAEIDSQRENT